jgi:P4 family phage/plasmid primase-like protien
MATTLRTFLDAHRSSDSEWNLTGMSALDKGKYHVSDDEYDTFLDILHSHIFGRVPRASSLLERHRDNGPILVDLDLRYETGGPLIRRFGATHIKNFIAQYVAAMIYFAKVESLTQDLEFYHLEKPAPETDKSSHKDGVHIQCPTITTTPRFQYCIRGFLLSHGIVEKLFGSSEQSNAPEDCYDVSVIHRNNWFLYGACKPDKAQYKIAKLWHISIDDIREALDGGDPTDFEELVDIVHDIMTEQTIVTDTLATMKRLSIRKHHFETTPLAIRNLRIAEWDALMSTWGLGKAKSEKVAKNTIEHVDTEEEKLVVTTLEEGEDSRRVTNVTSAEDIALAYRLCKECINAEHRAAEYQDWIRVAICLKNISNTEESFRAWVEITQRVDTFHKKANMTEADLRAKWNLVRVDSTRKLSMATLIHWAREDNPDKYRSILSESHTSWLIHFAKDTHVNVASFVCRMYQYEFRCSPGASKGRVEWYHYAMGSHAWKHLRQSVELRARLSGGIKNEYVTAANEVGKKLISSTDDGERERLDEKRKKLFGIERQLEMSSFKDNVLKECQEKFYDEEFMARLNTNPYLVGVANGVLDLRHYDDAESMTGRPRVVFRDGLPDDNISFQMGRCNPDLDPIQYIPYDAESSEQKFLTEFFRKIYPDPVLREYVITLLASCLEGANKEQKFYVMQGPGSNGKSMIEQLMENTFGDYGTSLSTTVFTRKKPDSGAANPDIITVKCRRYIHMGEPDDAEKINTSIMKQYSGGDRVAARGLFEDQDKFVITGKIFMSCNDLPTVTKMDNGTWRRIRVIPHVSVFKDPGDPLINPEKNIYEKDLDLENKLRHLRTAFLGLLVHYYDTKYLVHGLREPDCVSAASNRYKEENDIFMVFFNENFVKMPGAGPVMAIDVKKAWREWKRGGNKLCDLKEHQVLERMKETCGSGSTEKEFWSVQIADETDMSGARLLTPV